MAITVQDVNFTSIIAEKENKTYTFTWPTVIDVFYVKNNKKFKLSVNLQKNFRTDGASIPTIFQWFLPSWDNSNMKYNCGAIIHDCLYTLSGLDGYFTREECDDFIRGIWRVSGICRFKASFADVCLALFASGKEHWGNDNLDNKKNKLISIDVIPLT